jgi:hypothetical protein
LILALARPDRRDAQRRLHAAFVRAIDALADATIVHDAQAISASSGKTIHRVIARKCAASAGPANR